MLLKQILHVVSLHSTKSKGDVDFFDDEVLFEDLMALLDVEILNACFVFMKDKQVATKKSNQCSIGLKVMSFASNLF